jgi:hypothetical protein
MKGRKPHEEGWKVNKPLQDGFNEVAKVSLQIHTHKQGVVICQNYVDFRTPRQKTC